MSDTHPERSGAGSSFYRPASPAALARSLPLLWGTRTHSAAPSLPAITAQIDYKPKSGLHPSWIVLVS